MHFRTQKASPTTKREEIKPIKKYVIFTPQLSSFCILASTAFDTSGSAASSLLSADLRRLSVIRIEAGSGKILKFVVKVGIELVVDVVFVVVKVGVELVVDLVVAIVDDVEVDKSNSGRMTGETIRGSIRISIFISQFEEIM